MITIDLFGFKSRSEQMEKEIFELFEGKEGPIPGSKKTFDDLYIISYGNVNAKRKSGQQAKLVRIMAVDTEIANYAATILVKQKSLEGVRIQAFGNVNFFHKAAQPTNELAEK